MEAVAAKMGTYLVTSFDTDPPYSTLDDHEALRGKSVR